MIKLLKGTRPVLCALMLAAAVSPVRAQDMAALTLDQAIALALAESPALAAFAARVDAAAAHGAQASALPNPELSVGMENIYGDYDGLAEAEMTYGVSQLVELSGKRGNRIRIAGAEGEASLHARDAARLDLIRDVEIAYAETVAAQHEAALLSEEYDLAAQVRDSVAARVKAGKEPPVQEKKADIEHSTRRIALERARRDLETRKRNLVSLTGAGTGDFAVVIDSLPPVREPEAIESYRARLPENPDFKGLDSEVKQAEAGLSLEKAGAVPDPTISLGLKDFRSDNTQAFVAGVSFPLPVFDMNRAGVARAGHALNAVKLDRHGAQLSLDAALAKAHGDLANAYGEAAVLKSAVLPGAEEAFYVAREGYEAGKFGYLEVLDAQRTLFSARRQLNAAILDYHRSRAAIERMTAAYAQQPSSQGSKP